MDRRGLKVIKSILRSLDNSSDVQSLNRTVRIIDSLSQALANSSHTLLQNEITVRLMKAMT